MDYKRGLAQLRTCLERRVPDKLTEFNTLEERFHKNQRAERLFGSSENTRNEHSQIIYGLNELALEHCGISFNDLCMGRQLPSKKQPVPDDHEIIERLRRIEAKLDHGRAEDRQAVTQILDAIAQNRIEQAEAVQIVAELRAWTQGVQQSGLPLNPELREALDTLAEHTGSAYQYLQLALPIIPGILTYNVELGSQHQLDLKAIWERIKTRLGKGAKSDGATADPEALYGIGNRWAVLIGVNEYEDKANYGQLHVCVKDVEAIRERLTAGGFAPGRIRLLTDHTAELPTRANILTALKAVADATEPDDLLLVYYSGHGDEAGGESYLVGRDGRRLVLGDTAVSVSRVKVIIEEAPARAKVIMLDACHSGAEIGGKGPKPMSEEFIRRVFEQAEGLAILASCKQGQLSYEWRENERSVFTHFLLEALAGRADLDEKGFVTVQDANRHVANGVKLWASQRNVSQTPTLRYTVAGDIILTRLGVQSSKGTPASPPSAVVSVSLPEDAWSKFQKLAEARGKTPTSYLEFLIEVEYERNQSVTDLRVMPTLASWPTQQIELASGVLERLKSLSGAAPEQRISRIIREVTQTGTLL
jgi:predicted DNA-binding protein